jgi:hypothetical protein
MLLKAVFVGKRLGIFPEIIQHVGVFSDGKTKQGCLSQAVGRFEPIASEDDIVGVLVMEKIIDAVDDDRIEVDK